VASIAAPGLYHTEAITRAAGLAGINAEDHGQVGN
jgi:hypothetical protein